MDPNEVKPVVTVNLPVEEAPKAPVTKVDDTTPVIKDTTTIVDNKVDDKTTTTTTTTTTIDTQPIEIDGVEYKVNDKGDAINIDGSVFMTKEKIDSFVNTNPQDINIIDEIQKINNVIITNEKGEPIKYDPTPQGIAKRELDIINNTKVISNKEGVDNFFKANPDFAAMFDYKQRYGSLEGYGKNTDYLTINLDKSNKEQLKQFVIDEQLSKGNTLEIAKSFADFTEKNNQLETLGVNAFNNLKNNQLLKEQDRQSNFKKWADTYFGVEEDNNGNLKDLNVEGSLYNMIVTKGEFNGFKIPKDGIVVKQGEQTVKLNNKELFEFAAYAEQDGSTKLDKVINNYLSKASNKLTIGMYILKNGDLSELANDALNKQHVKQIKISTQNNKSTSKTINTSNNKTGNDIIVPVS